MEPEPDMMLALTEKEIENTKEVFQRYDEEETGYLRVQDLRGALNSIDYGGVSGLTDYKFYKMVSELEDAEGGMISFNEFLKVCAKLKDGNTEKDDPDTLAAFVAVGGEEDGGGIVKKNDLIRIINDEFKMTIDMNELIDKIDEDKSGNIEFGEFKNLLQSNHSNEDMFEPPGKV